MAKPDGEKSDGLEIILIGSLYSGPWDKKYWSSSRGKDRYPYPVGYKAVRTHNGITYKMEIHEGLKGPLFAITSADGQSCSGQTPDIAWDNLQKKGFLRIKSLHGKRFSCKIDGVEFFGFKNPFVQRLLRALVADADGTAETSFPPSSCINGSETKHHSQCTKSCNSDLLQFLAKTGIKGKRSRMDKVINSNSAPGASFKRLRAQEKHDADVSKSIQRTQGNHNGGNSNICSGAKEVNSLRDTEIQRFSMSMDVKDKDGEAAVPKDYPNVGDVDLCAPDTLDLHDTTSDFALTSHNGNCYDVKDELIAGKMVISEGLIAEPYPEEEMSTSNLSSEKSDFDSVGEEITKSMMTVLLPQAVPLLKTFSRKKKATANSLGFSLCTVRTQGEHNRMTDHVDVGSPAENHTENSPQEGQEKEKMQVSNTDPGSVFPSSGQVMTIVPDSLENDQCGFDPTNQLPPFSDVPEARLPTLAQETFTLDTEELLVGIDALKESSVPHVEISDCKTICSYDAARIVSTERPQNSDILIAEFNLGCELPNKTTLHESNNDDSRNYNTSPTCFQIHSSERDVKNLSHCTEAISETDDKLTGTASSVQLPHKEISVEKEGAGPCHASFNEFTNIATSKRNFSGPLTESIICRNYTDDCAAETCTTTKDLLAKETHPVCSSNHDPNRKDISGAEVKLDEHVQDMHQACADKELPEQQNIVEFKNSISWLQKNKTSPRDVRVEIKDGSHMNMGHNNDLENIVEFVGCYNHPMPILSVLLNKKGNEIYICVLSGILVDKDRTLFMYKVSVDERNVGYPSFIGHSPIMLPASRDAFGREIVLFGSGLQFTPDGRCLVLLNHIKAPFCREGKINCPCSECTLDSFENNVIKVVQVKLGHFSIEAKLKTIGNILSILVCGPNFLVGVEESGKLHLWVMNSEWSAQIEECDLPTSGSISPGIVELKQVPKCSALVVGHNGRGEFSLWDISKRVLVSKFSSPNTLVFQFLPISLFRWQIEGSVFRGPNMKAQIDDIMSATKSSFSKQDENNAFLPIHGEDMAIWLLMSVSDSDAQQNYTSSDFKLNQVGWWRLALLVKNMVIFGNALDPRAATIGASAGHGIIGTSDGLVYVWELSTGTKLGQLYCFQGAGVPCIAADNSSSGALAVACGCQLLVYLSNQQENK